MALYAVFGIGIGNVGRNRVPRRPMSKWVELLNRHLTEASPCVRIIGSFGHTGNFIASSSSSDFEEVSARFHCLLDTDWVVRSVEDVQVALRALAGIDQPPNEIGIRWTPGVAFHGGAGVAFGGVAKTPRAVLWKISPFAVGAWKHDCLATNGGLDRDRRAGGWGAVSDDIERQIGGRWTARSRRTVDGLVRKLLK